MREAASSIKDGAAFDYPVLLQFPRRSIVKEVKLINNKSGNWHFIFCGIYDIILIYILNRKRGMIYEL